MLSGLSQILSAVWGCIPAISRDIHENFIIEIVVEQCTRKFNWFNVWNLEKMGLVFYYVDVVN